MQDYGTRQTDLAVRRAEWRLSRVYRQAQRDIEAKIQAWQEGHAEREKKYRQMVRDGKLSQDDFNAWMRGQVFQGKQWQARKEEIDNILLHADKVAQQIINEGKIGVFTDNANFTGYELEHDGNVNFGFTLYDQPTVARLIKSDPQILPKARPGVQKDKAFSYYNKLINSAVTQGIIQGETIQEIARRIAKVTGERSYTSALRNARTAYTGAQNAGRIEGLHQAQRLGVKVRKKWMATLDGRTRDAHRDLDGQTQEVDDPFKSELGDIMFPADPTAAAGNVYNCRCTLVYDHPDYPSSMERRDAETGEIVGDMTYDQWYAEKAVGAKPAASLEDYDDKISRLRELRSSLFDQDVYDKTVTDRLLKKIESLQDERTDFALAYNFADGDTRLISMLRSDDVQSISNAINEILNSSKYNLPTSVWSGITRLETADKMDNAAGFANWDFSISIREDYKTDIKTHVHELLHMRSVHRYGQDAGPGVYRSCARIEEGSVEYLAQEICAKAGLSEYSKGYTLYVRSLRGIRQVIDEQKSDYDFAHDLIDIPTGSRYNYLRDKVQQYVNDHKDMTAEQRDNLYRMLDVLRGG